MKTLYLRWIMLQAKRKEKVFLLFLFKTISMSKTFSFSSAIKKENNKKILNFFIEKNQLFYGEDKIIQVLMRKIAMSIIDMEKSMMSTNRKES